MRIGIDFDRTLFDTDSFKQHLESRFPKFSDTYSESIDDGIYKPRIHAEKMGVELEDIYSEMRNCRKFLFESIDKLEDLKDDSTEIILVSRGDGEFQRLKIKGAKVDRFFDRIEIVSRSIDKLPKDKVVELDLLVDDRQEELDAVRCETIRSDPKNQNISELVEKIREEIR